MDASLTPPIPSMAVSHARLLEHFAACGYTDDAPNIAACTLVIVELPRGGLLTISTPDGNVGVVNVSAHGWIGTRSKIRAICLLAACYGMTHLQCYTTQKKVRQILKLYGFTYEKRRGLWWLKLGSVQSVLA